ncbi:Hsp20/alpha crystallin family protein [Fulvivirgaceae bacterium BMA10]|uniref:Hsp20/alpha crystallin family protein n=1 Tax=Splendidivirga corallicola TaxID=3051826 RepID=A0ABT8KRB1_9BACT|nr:Hsp20/alpha crystallin family protein [Fulvivirgaceae bacterium BMA10]
MALVKYRNRFNDFAPISFNSLLDNFFNDSWDNTSENNRFFPKVDVAETDKSFEISLAVPGIKKEDFKIDVNDGLITISGERKFINEDKGKNYHSIETQYGSFNKSFQLPDNVKVDKIEAKYEDGILLVNVPKDQKKTLKSKIEVK